VSLGVDLKTSGAIAGMVRMVRMKDKRKQIPAGRQTKDRQRRSWWVLVVLSHT